MIDRLKRLWQSTQTRTANPEQRLALAVAALLVEVMRIDGRLQEVERLRVMTALQQRFHLPEQEISSIIEQARAETERAHDLHQFTSQIIKAFYTDERIEIIRDLWQVAMADGHVDPHEEHLIRRIAELIGVYHREFIQAKIAAREES